MKPMERTNRSTKRPDDLPRLFAALADRTRLRLLNLMDGREVCVCYFVEILRQGQPKISRHLAYLRSAGIVAARREGKWMHYRIVPVAPTGADQTGAPTAASQILRETLDVLRSDRQMQADRRRLDSACCAPGKLTTIEAAPRPLAIKL